LRAPSTLKRCRPLGVRDFRPARNTKGDQDKLKVQNERHPQKRPFAFPLLLLLNVVPTLFFKGFLLVDVALGRNGTGFESFHTHLFEEFAHLHLATFDAG
jgi:hypothetical protein